MTELSKWINYRYKHVLEIKQKLSRTWDVRSSELYAKKVDDNNVLQGDMLSDAMKELTDLQYKMNNDIHKNERDLLYNGETDSRNSMLWKGEIKDSRKHVYYWKKES